MALKVKAVQTDLNHLTDAKGNKLGMRFLLKPELYSKLNDQKVIKEAALRSGVSKGVCRLAGMQQVKSSRLGQLKVTLWHSLDSEPCASDSALSL